MIIRGRLTTIPADLPVTNGTEVDIIRVKDSAALGTVTTTNGWYEWRVDGNPGRIQTLADYDGKIRNQWSEITGPSNGVDVGNIWMALNAFLSGRIQGFSGELTTTANGTGMFVSVSAGAALVKGQLYDRYTTANVNIVAAEAQPRKDIIIVRCWLNDTGDPDEGKTELLVIKGTAAASPVAPTLTNTSTVYDLLLATVDVPASASVISSGNVTPNLVYARPNIGPGSISTTEVADNSISTAKIQNLAVTLAKLAANSVDSSKIVDGSIVTADLADGSVTSAKILDGTIATVDIADNAITTIKLLDGAITSAKILDGTITGADIADATITAAKLTGVVLTGSPTLLPISEFVATGPLGSGTRQLKLLAVGPMLTGKQYDIQAKVWCTWRNNVNTGTCALKLRINGGTYRSHEFQTVGGVPRLVEINQSVTFTGAGVTIDVEANVDFISGDATDIRAGEVSVIAIPR